MGGGGTRDGGHTHGSGSVMRVKPRFRDGTCVICGIRAGYLRHSGRLFAAFGQVICGIRAVVFAVFEQVICGIPPVAFEAFEHGRSRARETSEHECPKY